MSHTHESRFERLYCFHGCHVTEHVLLSTYANFCLLAFLLKSFSVEKCIINNSFKNKVCSQYQAWMMNGPFNYAPLGKKRAPSEDLVSQWIHTVHKAWQEIPAHLDANAFNDRQLVSFSCVV